MTYPLIQQDNFLDNLLLHKEFYSLKYDPNRDFRGVDDPLAKKHLQIHSHQIFVSNFMNIDTLYKRILLKHGTGTGKTLAAISIAIAFINAYKQLYTLYSLRMQSGRRGHSELDRITPSVYVFGFAGTKQAFLRDLMRYPELGFITINELKTLMQYQQLAKSGTVGEEKIARDYYNMLKKKITNKAQGGFFKFYGYQELVNRLFLSNSGITFTDLETIVKKNPETTLQQVIKEHLEDGKIMVNTTLLSQFENSLIICDEVHNIYNSAMKNNYGVAIQYILDYHDSVRAVFLSATPINNSPTEVVDIINLLSSANDKITRADLFQPGGVLRDNALDIIASHVHGKISFLQDINPKYYPERKFVGETIHFDRKIGHLTALPYLLFTKCVMSPLHLATLRAAIPKDGDIWHVPSDGNTIYDMVFPNPTNTNLDVSVGLFKSFETRNLIMNAPETWKDKHQIKVSKFSNTNIIFQGHFLHMDNIAIYSAKYASLLNEIFRTMLGAIDPLHSQKIMIYHDRVKMSGVLLIQELLRENGFLDEYSDAVDSTICTICGIRRDAHVEGTHQYMPARFIAAHSDMDRLSMENALNRYNAPDNANGLRVKILIGSKIIKESIEVKCIQHLFIVSIPANIPTLIQIFGRCIRKGSHEALPSDQHTVSVRIFISVMANDTINGHSEVSPEEVRYSEKLFDYTIIQRIERVFNSSAIDASISRDIIMPQELLREYFPSVDFKSTTTQYYDVNGYNNAIIGKQPVDTIGNLYFDAKVMPELSLSELNLTTFRAYNHYDREIHDITNIIKRLFLESHIWTYDDLFIALKTPPTPIETNPTLFSEDNFNIALHQLIDNNDTIVDKGMTYKVVLVGEYYIAFPVTEHGEIIQDIESYTRTVASVQGLTINLNAYIDETKLSHTYIKGKQKLFLKYKAEKFNYIDFLSDYPHDFYGKLIEDIITYKMNIVLGINNPTDTILTMDELCRLYNSVIHTFNKFGIIIYVRDIIKNKDVLRVLSDKNIENCLVCEGKLQSGISPALPIGYIDLKSARIYNRVWTSVSKSFFNIRTDYRENDLLIGYFEVLDNNIKFKIRKPLSAKSDIRLVERGIVCITKSSDELNAIVKLLGIKFIGKARVRNFCYAIKQHLIEKEINERQKGSNIKWFYIFNEVVPSITGSADTDIGISAELNDYDITKYIRSNDAGQVDDADNVGGNDIKKNNMSTNSTTCGWLYA